MRFKTRSLLRDQHTDNGGGGGGGGSGDRTFTQAEVDAFVKSRLKSKDAELAGVKADLEARPTAEELNDVKAKLAQLEEERELENKTELERMQHKHDAELKLRDKRDAETRQKIEALEREAEAGKTKLRNERLSRTFGEALDRKGVLGGDARRSALRDLMTDMGDQVQIGEDGSVLGTWGDHIEKSPDDIAEAFLESRPFYKQPVAGGAGTKTQNGTGAPAKPYYKMSNAELDRQIDKLDAADS